MAALPVVPGAIVGSAVLARVARKRRHPDAALAEILVLLAAGIALTVVAVML